MHGHPVVILMLAIVCSAACADGGSRQRPAADTVAVASAAPVRDTGPSVMQSGEYPRFVAGTYELVLDRDEPLFDDSLAVRDLVDKRLPTDATSARDWRDSIRVLGSGFKAAMRNEFSLPDLATADDSARVMREDFASRRCEEWRSGGRVILAADGRITTQDDYREYCGGKLASFTRRVSTNVDTLGICDWKAPVPGTVPHLTCRWGRRGTGGDYHFQFAGDTLTLSSDCDGRDTYVLRKPDPAAQYAVKRSSDVARLEEC